MLSSTVHAHRGGDPPTVTHLTSVALSPSRISEALDQVRIEYESAVQQLTRTKMEQVEAERKLQAQAAEMAQIQKTLQALEANHRHIRQQYEEDIMCMRRQLKDQQSSGVKLPTKRYDTPTSVPAISASGEKEDQRSNSSVRVPVQPAPRSLQQLSQPPVLPGPPSQEPPFTQLAVSPQLRPLKNQSTTSMSRSADLIPPLRNLTPSERNEQRTLSPSSDTQLASRPPVLKKPRTNGDSMQSLSNGKSAESSPIQHTQIKPNVGAATSKPKFSGDPNTTSSPGKGSVSTSSSSGGRKHNWNCAYSDNQSERPVVEMYKTMDHQSVVCSVRMSADGTMMATGCHKTTRVFDIKSGECKFASAPTRYGRVSTNDDAAYVRAVAFSPDNTKLVAGMPHNTIRVWDIATNEEGPAMSGHEAPVYGIDYVYHTIASGSGDGTVRLWDDRTGQCKKIFGSESGGPSDGVTSVALSPDGRYLAAGSLDKVVRIWDTESSQLLDRLEGHSDSVYSIAFSPDGKQLVSGAQDHNIMLWDVNAQGRTSSRPRMVFQGHKDFVLSVAYSPDGRLMSGSKDRSVVFWDPRSSRSLLTLTGYRNSVISVASSPASPYFATGSGDCLAVVWKYSGTQ